MSAPIVIAALYKFVKLDDASMLRERLYEFCETQGLKGTLLLAREGLNGTVAGSEAGVAALHEFLTSDPRFEGLSWKTSHAEEPPFGRLKVKLKREIVSFGQDVSPTEVTGVHVPPEDWNALISDPEVVVVDTRNRYETHLGSFRGATDPQTEAFREFPEYVKSHLDPARHRRVAMFCTGGIRCEKASAWMLEQGFETVYQLEGGILNYLEHTPPEESLWEGECFVFDDRVTVDHRLSAGSREVCPNCRMPVSEEDKASEDYEAHICCPMCVDRLTEQRRRALEERRRQRELAAAR